VAGLPDLGQQRYVGSDVEEVGHLAQSSLDGTAHDGQAALHEPGLGCSEVRLIALSTR
jgi:hypothetical protein